MDTAHNSKTPHYCLVFLHPAAANCPEKIREIYNATGLVAIAGLNSHAAELIPPGQPDGPWDGGSAA